MDKFDYKAVQSNGEAAKIQKDFFSKEETAHFNHTSDDLEKDIDKLEKELKKEREAIRKRMMKDGL